MPLDKPEYKYSDLTGKVIGCAMEVHRHLGNGFQEIVYQRALSIELNMNNIEHVREQEIPLTYKGHDIGTRRADFFIDGLLINFGNTSLQFKRVMKPNHTQSHNH